MRMPTVSRPAVSRSGTCGCFRQHQRQRPGPESSRQLLGALRPLAHQAARHLDGAHVNDQRTRRRPSFRGVDLRRSPPDPAHSRPARTRSRWEMRPVRPARIRAPARLISDGSLRQILFSIACDLAGVFANQERVHQPIQIAVQHAIHVADGELGAMILDHAGRAPARSCGSGCRS